MQLGAERTVEPDHLEAPWDPRDAGNQITARTTRDSMMTAGRAAPVSTAIGKFKFTRGSLVNWQLFAISHSPEIRPALRVGLGLGLPGIALLLIGRTDLLAYAVFGSIVGMYGRNPHRSQRLKDQVLGAALMLCAGICGIAMAPLGMRGWTLLAGGMFWAAFSSLIADRYGLKPGGAFFPLFAFGALGTLPVGSFPPLKAWPRSSPPLCSASCSAKPHASDEWKSAARKASRFHGPASCAGHAPT